MNFRLSHRQLENNIICLSNYVFDTESPNTLFFADFFFAVAVITSTLPSSLNTLDFMLDVTYIIQLFLLVVNNVAFLRFVSMSYVQIELVANHQKVTNGSYKFKQNGHWQIHKSLLSSSWKVPETEKIHFHPALNEVVYVKFEQLMPLDIFHQHVL